ncbi:hypothetical protein C8R46DRAFT_1205459 [Mycena filopes]|nr:hypothetical protein C8R46DRAFT_1205459 [Mycena filopes]
MDAMGAFGTASCTVVAFPGVDGSSRLTSHDFYDLSIPVSALKVHATNGTSIDLYTLLTAITLRADASSTRTGEIAASLQMLLTNPHSYPTLRLSTTRVPIFDARMQGPAFGYRSFGYFASLVSSIAGPPYFPAPGAPPIHLGAIYSNAPEASAWKDHLLSLEVHVERHFILILSDYQGPSNSPSPPTTRHTSPVFTMYHSDTPGGTSPFSSPIEPSAPDFDSFDLDKLIESFGPTSNSPSPSTTRHTSPAFTMYHSDTPGGTSPLSSPIEPSAPDFNSFDLDKLIESFGPTIGIAPHNTLLSGENGDLDTWLALNSSPQSAVTVPPEPASSIGPQSLSPGLDITEAFNRLGVTAEMRRKAKNAEPHSRSRSRSGSLWGMVNNHRDAVALLDHIGLDSRRAGSHIELDGGLTLTLSDVLKHLGWTERTFIRKGLAYRNARTVAAHLWTDPGADADEKTRKLFVFWKAIADMFSVGGTADQPYVPRDRTSTEPELIQAQLYAKLTNLSSYLQRV